MALLAVLWDLDPAMHALLALLHDREIDGLAGLELLGERAYEHEFVIVRVGELTAGPRDLGYAFGHLGAAQRIGPGVPAGDGVELPAGLRHRLHANHAVGDAHADGGSGGALTAMGHAHDCLVGGADRRLFRFKCDVRKCAGGDREGTSGGSKKATKHWKATKHV